MSVYIVEHIEVNLIHILVMQSMMDKQLTSQLLAFRSVLITALIQLYRHVLNAAQRRRGQLTVKNVCHHFPSPFKSHASCMSSFIR